MPYNGLFKKLTAKSAYWLGMLAADGNMRKNRHGVKLNLKEEDKYLVEQFALDCGFFIVDVKKSNHKKYNKNYSNQYIFCMWRKEPHEDLFKMGLRPNKTLSIDETIIPKKYVSHFVRGLFDGDGTVGCYKYKRNKNNIVTRISICGQKKFLLSLSKIIPAKGYLIKNGKNCYKLDFNKKSEIIILIKWMYKNKNRYMIRKYNICMKMLDFLQKPLHKKYSIYINNIGDGYEYYNCDYCNKRFLIKGSELPRCKHHYCSKICFYKRRKNNATCKMS